MGKKIVVALGGNAILQPGQRGTASEQMENIRATCAQIAEMVAQGHQVVVTHGNGPQVGNILIQNQAGSELVPAMPLDVCGAESQGLIGYMMQQSLQEALALRNINKPVVTVITQAVVDKNDPAFKNPTKPVGPFYDEAYAKKEMERTGDTWIEDSGRGWRKVVPSPDPLYIVERDSIRALIEAGQVVIANGGGGIPVIENGVGFKGVEAVIDKDLGGQRLAKDVGADIFMILTDVPGAAINYNTDNEQFLQEVTIEEIKAYYAQGHFKAGSMQPKVLACIRFVEAGGEMAIIASLNDALKALSGKAGTRIVPGKKE